MKKFILALGFALCKNLLWGQCPNFGTYYLTVPIIESKFNILKFYKPKNSLKLFIELRNTATKDSAHIQAVTNLETEGCYISFAYKLNETTIYNIGVMPCKVVGCKNDIELMDLDYKVFYAEGLLQK